MQFGLRAGLSACSWAWTRRRSTKEEERARAVDSLRKRGETAASPFLKKTMKFPFAAKRQTSDNLKAQGEVWRAVKAVFAEAWHPVGPFLAFLLGMAAAKAVAPISAWLLGQAVAIAGGAGGGGAGPLALMGLAGAFAVAKIAEAILSFARVALGVPIMGRVGSRLLMRAYGALAKSSPELLRRPAGELSARADCIGDARAIFSHVGASIAPAALELGVACGFMWSQNLGLAAWGLLAAAAMIFAISMWIGPKASLAAKRAAWAAVGSRAKAVDLLPGFLEAKALGREDEAVEAFRASVDAEAAAASKGKIVDQAIDAGFALSAGMGAAIVFFVGARGMEAGTVSGAQFVASITVAALALAPIASLGWAARELRSSAARLSLALDLINAPAERSEGVDPAENPPQGAPLLLIENARLAAANGRMILSGASIRIEPGQKVALIGSSGGGKTTFAGLATLLSPIDSGRVELLGCPMEVACPKAWRRLVGWVPQSPRPAMTTPMEFLALARPGIQKEQAEELMAALGLDLSASEHVGPGARALSGGEWQRLSCTRALATESKLLVFDEPSSALDSASERLLMDALLSDSRAVLAVTHRLGHAKRFDAIAMMENGAIVQFGSHGELAAVDGPYRRLWEDSKAGFA